MNKAIFIVFFTFVWAGQALGVDRELIENVVIYDTPPSAYELAKQLFPPRTRSIIAGQDDTETTAVEKTPGSVAFLIHFEFDSINVTKDTRSYLDVLGEMLNFRDLSQKSLMIEGHADAVGDDDYNLKLSEARANVVKEYLVGVHKIDPKRLYTTGYGESKLLEHGSPNADVNRRTEFKPWDANGK